MTRHLKNVEEAAREMIRRFGPLALQQLNQRVLELQEHGEDEAVLLWQEIRVVVTVLMDNGGNGKTH